MTTLEQDIGRKKKEKMENQPFVTHPPKICPNCGATIAVEDVDEYWSHSDWTETPERPYYGVGYEVNCKKCGWSGRIEPDEDDSIEKAVGEDLSEDEQ